MGAWRISAHVPQLSMFFVKKRSMDPADAFFAQDGLGGAMAGPVPRRGGKRSAGRCNLGGDALAPRLRTRLNSAAWT